MRSASRRSFQAFRAWANGGCLVARKDDEMVEASPQQGSPSAASSKGQCTLPYPDRFHAAVAYVSSLKDAEAAFSDEVRLLFYALGQQATIGPCQEPKPWGWQVVESAKWASWSQLGNMSAMEAMRLFIRTLEEVKPDWWNNLPPGALNGAAGASATEPVSLADIGVAGGWVSLEMDGAKKPLARYEQGAAVIGNKLYVVGGHYGSRYLSDVWSFDLTTLKWSQLDFKTAAASEEEAGEASNGANGAQQQEQEEAAPMLSQLPACAGHSMTPYQGTLLLLGGHAKGRKVGKKPNPPGQISLWQLDLATQTAQRIQTTGSIPCARGGHSACLVRTKLWVFGGEDSNRRPLCDLYQLDVTTWTWSQLTISSKQQPQPRSGHTAAVYQGKVLLLFGGGSLANCFNDCWVLDLQSLEWSQPTALGDVPSARAGHCGVLCDDVWYIVGGGNNVKGCTDMLAADLSELAVGNITWNRSNIVPARSVLSSEGISLVHVSKLNALVAFGGYNGKYNNTISIYRPHMSSPAAKAPATDTAKAATEGKPQAQPNASSATQQLQQQQQQGQPAASGGGAAAGASPKATAATAASLSPTRTDSFPSLQDNGAAKGHEQSLLRELAISREQLKRDLATAREVAAAAAEAAAAAQESSSHELALMRRQLAAAQAALGETERSLEECRHQLSAEQARTLKLEAELAEARSRLGQVEELERELERLRKAEQESNAKKGGGGVWGYITGAQA